MSANAHHCWAIITPYRYKADQVIDQVIEELKRKNIKVVMNYRGKDWADIIFECGHSLKWIGHSDNFKGFRFHRLWCDKDVDGKYLEQVILPMACYMKYEDIVWI